MNPQVSFRTRRALYVGVAAATATLLLGLPSGAAAAVIVGVWLTEDGSSRVEIAANPASGSAAIYSGKVVWLKEPTRDGQALRDANNSDAALRERPIMGLEILSGFKAAAGGGWAGGSIYSPRAGKGYPAELAIGADGRLQVKVKAGLVSKTVYWTR